jgi:hypothetical protein
VSVQGLLDNLRQRDVRLEADGELLRVDAPSGTVTEELRDALVEHKSKLLKLLERERDCERRDLKEADRLSMVVRWSEYPTWIRLRDSSTGEWHEVRASECLPSIVQSANAHWKRRKDMSGKDNKEAE